MKIYKNIKAFFYSLFFFTSICSVFVLFYLTNSQDKIWRIRKGWARLQAKVLKINFELEGEFDNSAQIILMNHQSMLDIIALEALYPKNLAWIAKKELGELPIFKIAMKKPKLLCIDRKNPRDIVRILKEAKERLNEGRILAIFPEGTRSKSEKMLKFQNGVKILGEKLNLKIQPILIVDSAKIMDSKNFSVSSGTLHLIALPCIDTNDEKWLENTYKNMQDLLDKQRFLTQKK